MDAIRLYHVMSRLKLEADRVGGLISCTIYEWHPYDAGSVVFLFEDLGEAIKYAEARSKDDPVIVALLVERSDVEDDRSSRRTAREEFLDRYPDEAHLAPHVEEGRAWRSARIHRGPLPIPVDVELVAPFI